jgi:hypothetical protein
MDSGILMQQDSILVCSPNLRIPHTAKNICKNHQTITTSKLKANPILLGIANAISLGVIEYVTNSQPHEGKIKKEDYVNQKISKKIDETE